MITWDQTVEILLTTAGIEPVSECTGCKASVENWSCRWMDKLCEIDLDFGYIISGEYLNRKALTDFTWHLAMYKASVTSL